MRIKKILLISPPAYTFKNNRDINPLPPIGLGYLASIAEGLGIEVNILDCLMEGWNTEEEVDDSLVRVGISYDTIKEKVKLADPDIIGINCQFSRQYKIYHELLFLIKKVKPNCITIAGGPHATVCANEVLDDPNCDFVIIGEAENSFRDLVLFLNAKKDINPRDIDGLGWKNAGKICINEKKKWISDLDSLPLPAFHLMSLPKYFGLAQSHGHRHRKKFMPIVTSRGCPARCTFCSAKKVWGAKYRTRSVENVIKEMKLLYTEYGVEEIMFEDDNVTANPKRAKNLFLRMIEEGFEFVWDTPNGVGAWSIDEEMLDLMKKSGCIMINFPVESGSQRVLSDIIKKPLDLAKVKRLIKYCKTIGLDYGMFLVIGMPGEKIEDMWQSFHFAAECGCYNPHISVATPYAGTELHDVCIKNSYIDPDFDFSDLFIRSFCITTEDWNGDDLKRILKNGRRYLLKAKYRKYPHMLLIDAVKGLKIIIQDPISFPKKFLRFVGAAA
ncbi:B12-binding domain-containing radical SAM protein [Patescibacteria group bacterium]|nr:B12-binding domain-containing radical SAM protein [Patescibacteria group bacterium]MBU4069294.1 B12-binding domain-containing radical SAM protein [Pseudomonadota bacterium]